MSLVKKIDFRRALTIFFVLVLLGLCTVLNLTRLDKSVAWSKPDAAKNSVNTKHAEAKDNTTAEKAENLSLRVRGEFKPLDSIPRLEIKDKENYLVFKYEVKNKRDRIELDYSLVKDEKTIEGGFKLNPPRTIYLNSTNPQDSLRLDILSDSLFEKDVKGVELVIFYGKGKEPFRISISFMPKMMSEWKRGYIRFLCGNDEIEKSTKLPFNINKWQDTKIKNNSNRDISVSYQIAKDSNKKISLDNGAVVVKKSGGTEDIPWGERTVGIRSVTFKFKVRSGEEAFDTTFTINTSSGPIYAAIWRFFSNNWITIPLVLLILGLGCFIYYLWGKNIEFMKKFHSSERLVKVKEEEINRLKKGKAGLLLGNRNLENEPIQFYQQIGEAELGSSGDLAVKKTLNLSWDRYERILSTLNLTRADFKNRIDELSDAQLKIKQLELQCSELNKKKTELEQELKAKEKTMNQDEETVKVTGKKKGKKKEFTISKADYDKICKENNDLKSQFSELNENLVKKQEDLSASNEEYLQKESRLKAQIEMLNWDLIAKDEICAKMTCIIEVLKEKEKYMAEDTNSLNLSLAKAFMQISKLEETIANLKNEVDISQNGTDIADETGSVKRNLERA